MDAQNTAALTGLQQLEQLVARNAQPPICDTLKFALVEISAGRAVFAGIPGDHAYNPIGSVHGGYAATLLDSACGCAVHSKLSATQVYTTLELKVSYLKGMTQETGEVRAEGVVISMGRRTAFAEAKITDANGKLLATASSTLLVMDKVPPAA